MAETREKLRRKIPLAAKKETRANVEGTQSHTLEIVVATLKGTAIEIDRIKQHYSITQKLPTFTPPRRETVVVAVVSVL